MQRRVVNCRRRSSWSQSFLALAQGEPGRSADHMTFNAPGQGRSSTVQRVGDMGEPGVEAPPDVPS